MIHLVVPLALTVAVLVIYTAYLTWRMHKTDERCTAVALARYEEIQNVAKFATALQRILGVTNEHAAAQMTLDEDATSSVCACDKCVRWRKDHGIPEPDGVCDAPPPILGTPGAPS